MGVKQLMILPGDGIGPEIVAEAEKVLSWFTENSDLDVEIDHGLIGGQAYDAHGVPLSDGDLEKCRSADAILMGSVGGPKWDDVEYNVRPEAGLLRLRKELDLFANLRPAIVFDALVDASTLKPEIVKGLDILIVRELTSGVYFGEPRGIEDLGTNEEGGVERRGFNTQIYTTSEIRRITKVAFELARKRGNKVHSCEKANVMESGKLWREEVTTLHGEGYDDINLEHMYADNCAMQLCRNPRQFDVIVTDNLFGDILSDEAAMLTGSLGMLPSASLGAEGVAGLYEPVHGSAPDIMGQNKANPLATILSLAMLLRYSFDRGDLAELVENAAQDVLNAGIRTVDIAMSDGCAVSTSAMGDALIDALSKNNAQSALQNNAQLWHELDTDTFYRWSGLIISEMFIPVFGFFALIGLALIFAGTSLAYDPSLAEYGIAMILAISLALSLIVGGGLIVAVKAYRKRTQTGKEGMIGDDAVIIDWNGEQGRVFVDGENWHAEAEKAYDFAKDDVVRVLEMRDLTLIIEPKA